MTMMKVKRLRKKCDFKSELTYKIKDKHQIEKMPSKLDTDDLVQI